MRATPLHQALAWFAQRDEMGGFRTVAAALFPGWEPKRCCRAPHREERTASFSFYRNGYGEWRFKDFGTGEQGGLVGFAMLAGMEKKQACHWLMEKAGVKAGAGAFAFSVPWKSETVMKEPESFPRISLQAGVAWSEGVDFAQGRPERAEALAKFRGWPVEFARHLVERAHVSMPLYHGKRTMAFLVEAPQKMDGRLVMWNLGFHARLEAQDGDKRASWRFVPNEAENGQRTPALPFILGGSGFDTARLLIIMEGQWDALTFALAAGWLGEGCSWPKGVCVIGARGASGENVFLQYYRQFWPATANCMVFPDADGPGQRWHGDGPDSFTKRLARCCRKVAVVRCGAHKDFNDLYRARPITTGEIAALLASHGMALESEAAA